MTKSKTRLEGREERPATRSTLQPARWCGRAARLLAGFALAAATTFAAQPGECQIKRPGAHPHYSVELEPHLLIQHDRNWRGNDEGFGLGLRATIPLVHNGPIPQINNSMGIGFGLDWASFGSCDEYWELGDCNADFVWVPIVVQWNFFFTPVVSVFAEPGAAMVYRTWGFEGGCPIYDENECDDSDFDPFEPVFFAGGRFLFSDKIGLVVRLGTPYVSLGATFLL
jgi:hypothetical protein